MAKLLPSPDTVAIQERLIRTLSILHPERTEFTLAEIMDALHVMGELS